MKLPKTHKFLRLAWPRALILVLLGFGLVSNASSHGGRGINHGQQFETGANYIELIGAAGDKILMIGITDKTQKRFRF